MTLVEQVKVGKEQQKIEFSQERQEEIEQAEDYLYGEYRPLESDYE